MSDQAVRTTLEDGGVAVIRLDDGKANALSHSVLDALADALDRIEKDDAARALVLLGREGRFSGGFDLSVMSQGVDKAIELADKGGRTGLRLFGFPKPVVLGVTGHAIAMGAVLLCAADERIGAEGAFKIGLNEVSIGMALPEFAVELARERLSRRHFQRATIGAQIYTPAEAVDAGYLDALVPLDRVEQAAIERAGALGASLDPKAFHATKRAVRGALIERLERGLGG